MSEGRFQDSISDRESLVDQVKNHGSSGEEFAAFARRLAANADAGPTLVETNDSARERSAAAVLNYLEGDERIRDPEKKQQFQDTPDPLDRLELLREMSPSDAVECITLFSNEKGSRYLSGRLAFYDKLISGQVHQQEQQWDGSSWKWVLSENVIDPAAVSAETVKTGLLRDMLYAEMIGTPELAIHKLANKQCEEQGIRTEHMPPLRGYHSGIDYGEEGSTGPYWLLREVYDQAQDRLESKATTAEWNPEKYEHKAVLLASKWLADSMDYNNPKRGPQSPYSGSWVEGIAWAQLGEGVKRQFRGMRRKIMDVDLHNIGRFVGRAGDNRYAEQAHKLKSDIAFAGDPQEWFAEEGRRLDRRLTGDDHLKALDQLDRQYAARQADLNEQLEGSSREEILAGLNEELAVAETRAQNNRSLAEKAIGLHFRFNGLNDDGTQKEFEGLIDWINDAPLGTIKRTDRAIREGVSEEAALALAITTTVMGQQGMTRVEFNEMKTLLGKSKDKPEVLDQLKALMSVGQALAHHDYAVPLEQIEEIAGKNWDGLDALLDEYELTDVAPFIEQDVILRDVASCRHITKEFGHDLSPQLLVDMAQHRINGLEKAMGSFELEEVQLLLRENVYLPTAVSVKLHLENSGKPTSIAEMAGYAKNLSSDQLDDFDAAIKHLPHDQVQTLLEANVSFERLNNIRGVLSRHGHHLEFDALLDTASKINPGTLQTSLGSFTLEQVNQALMANCDLRMAVEVNRTLHEINAERSMEDVIAISQNRGWAQLEGILEEFDLDTIKRYAKSGVNLTTATRIRAQIRERRITQLDDTEIIAVIAKQGKGGLEAAEHTLEAGYSIEEIRRFPFLISNLASQR